MRKLLLGFALATGSAAIAQDAEPNPATPAAREALAAFASCVAMRSPTKASSALTMDFKTKEYRGALLALSTANRDCFRQRGTMRAGGLPFAAALAEALLRRDPTPLNVRLLRATRNEAPTFAPSDRVAMCVARSDPDNSAALLTAAIASDAERRVSTALEPAVRRCSTAGVMVDVDPNGLRSILATASYRLLATAPDTTERR